MPKATRIWWSAIWLDAGSEPNLDELVRQDRELRSANASRRLVVTIDGTLRTKKGLKIVRAPDGRGDTMGNGYGVGGAYPAVLVIRAVRDIQIADHNTPQR